MQKLMQDVNPAPPSKEEPAKEDLQKKAVYPEPGISSEKKIKTLRKKLRQIGELEAQSEALSAQEQEKVDKKSALEEDLASLMLST